VLHLGCVNPELLEEGLASGELLHVALRSTANELYGIDLDHGGLQRLRAAGFDHLYEADIQEMEALRLDRSFDVVVAGEIVEHLANPGLFLRQIPRFMARDGKLIVTVPNAQSIRLVANAFRFREVVHPDHNAYYSPQTLDHLLESHGFRVDEIRPYWVEPRTAPLVYRLYDRALGLSRIISPWLGEGLVATAVFRGDQQSAMPSSAGAG
jgi:predicted TPR repeat methyltransferase